MVSEGEGEAVVELSLQVDRASHHVKVNTWSVCTIVIQEGSSIPYPYSLAYALVI